MASIDRLSSLQDEVICHILSFLPTKFSVATSVLGQRWRFLWAHVPSLHFNGVNFGEEGTQASDIVNRLDNNRASLSAVKNVSLPSLKKLYVYHLICENDDALPRFLSGCPSLEVLNMTFKFVEEDDYVGCINISSPTIKMLQIRFDFDCFSFSSFSLNPKYRMVINAPALRYLEVYGYDLKCITIPITLISLVEADIIFDSCRFSKLETDYNSTLVKFLHSLSYVKCLMISGRDFEEEQIPPRTPVAIQLSGLSDGEQNMAWIDRLSSLQDEVICHILSFLPTKFSVATSVLGKRWRFLWAYVPSLHFSEDDFREEGTQASDIINRVLFRHKAKRLDILTLNGINCNEFQLETFITTAIDRSIRNLYLELDLDTFPLFLFNCKTIVDLKLDNSRASLSAVKNVSLPSLKKLYVSNLICENDDALPRFLSGCPSLEELNMKFTFVEEDDYVGCINISSPTVKMLQIECDNSCKLEYRMIINAPSLMYLEVYGYDLECITIPITLISLIGADISLKVYSFSNLKTNHTSTVVKFLHSLCYVKCLKISCWEFEEFVHRGVACSTVKFDNLTKLKVLFNFKWSVLVKFLEVADNLQVLTVLTDRLNIGVVLD
ncbi:F-box/RNI-like/FBD-like domains-containing protein, partial [Striga asiatica]